ncbi:PHP domain-containing protein [Desulfatiferula olefinivorans]
MTVDLHIHSTASDGSLTPRAILDQARALGLKAVSITDHDTIDGIRAALTPAEPKDLHVLPGVEISAHPPEPFADPGSFHLLGYGFRLDDPDLNATLETLRTARHERNPKILSRLADLGMDLSPDEVYNDAADGAVGRPHIARAMMRKGYAADIDEAFDRYLSEGRPAFVDKARIACAEALCAITRAGGIAVLAHPVSLGMDLATLEGLLRTMIPLGLEGLEAYYPDHTPALTRAYIALSRELGLIATGGSDFHGAFKPEIRMGSGKGSLRVPFHAYLEIMNRLDARSGHPQV